MILNKSELILGKSDQVLGKLHRRGFERARKRLEEVLVAIEPHDLGDGVAAAQLLGARSRVVGLQSLERRSGEPGPVSHRR